jgi:hypothetical protein
VLECADGQQAGAGADVGDALSRTQPRVRQNRVADAAELLECRVSVIVAHAGEARAHEPFGPPVERLGQRRKNVKSR